jgi:V8-like Glu-specific endopeptidase
LSDYLVPVEIVKVTDKLILLEHNSHLTDGMSGAPLIVSMKGIHILVGVYVGGNKDGNIATKLTPEINEWITKWTNQPLSPKELSGNLSSQVETTLCK